MNKLQANKKATDRLANRTMGLNHRYIVENGNPSPSGVVMDYCIILEDVTDFACTDDFLTSGSADYPTSLIGGIELPSGLKDISVSTGKVLCIYK